MNILIHLALICLHAVLYINASCEEARQLESTCGTYCFQAIRPVLEHTKTLQQKVHANEVIDNERLRYGFESFEKKVKQFEIIFETMEHKLVERLDTLDEQMKKYLKFGKFKKIGDKYYAFISNERANWLDAYKTCEMLGGYLARPQNEDEFRALREYTSYDRYWIDITREIGNHFIYSTGETAKFLSWDENEPNNGNDNENCVELINVDPKFGMNDNVCNKKFGFVCEQ